MTETSGRRPRLVDSHAHLDMAEFDPDREDVLRRSFEAGLEAVLCPADLAEPRSFPLLRELRGKFPGLLLAAGIHPHQALRFNSGADRELRRLAAAREIRAIGEIGLDFHYDIAPREVQAAALEGQLACARETGLPVILHSRLSGPEILGAVDAAGFTNGGILHCFTEDWTTAKAVLDRGFHISFSGILTFPKAQEIREVAGKVPLDRLLVETDSPYLVPVPHRGKVKRNEPSFVVETARRLAELRGLAPEDLAEATTANFFALFPASFPSI
jgi:TatD DNase family protein